jgi:CheY-like chemotaxis protein
LSSILESVGFTVKTTTSAEQGLQLAHDWEPDVILVDYKMPQLMGDEVARKVILSKPDAVVFIMSASVERDIESDCIKAGAKAFIEKPVRQEQLLNLIEQYTHVQYQYQEVSKVEHISNEQLAEDLLQIDLESFSLMQKAIKIGDIKGLKVLSNNLAKDWPILAQQLIYWAENYQLAKLKSLLLGIKRDGTNG